MTELRDRIAAVLSDHFDGGSYCSCGEPDDGGDWGHEGHVADAVIRELGAIPDREFTDQWGHHWEWCGGVTGTWAWRITRLEQR